MIGDHRPFSLRIWECPDDKTKRILVLPLGHRYDSYKEARMARDLLRGIEDVVREFLSSKGFLVVADDDGPELRHMRLVSDEASDPSEESEE